MRAPAPQHVTLTFLWFESTELRDAACVSTAVDRITKLQGAVGHLVVLVCGALGERSPRPVRVFEILPADPLLGGWHLTSLLAGDGLGVVSLQER